MEWQALETNEKPKLDDCIGKTLKALPWTVAEML
jgi:hypothetical protein